MTVDEISGKIGMKVWYRGRLGEIDSAPSYALHTVRILDPLQGRIMVKVEEIRPASEVGKE